MEYYCFTLNASANIDTMWDRLSDAGFQLLYSNEEPCPNNPQITVKSLFGYLPQGMELSKVSPIYPEISTIHPVNFDQIDWHAQWGTTPESPTIFIDLNTYSNSAIEGLKMLPGPGFGDLSHPTTRLVLQMMAPLVQGKWVIDLGSGSGILSLAALKLGALGACGIDIDPAAIEHAQQNARLNSLEELCHFQLLSQPFSIPEGFEFVLLMNMIHSEQKEAWNSMPLLHSLPMVCLTSGILSSEEDLYQAICRSRGWQHSNTLCEAPWCGFHHSQ
jgi:ribosomal protein L11 methyltransferase